jgi:hypothetical protein
LIRQIQLARTVGALDQLPIDLVAPAIDVPPEAFAPLDIFCWKAEQRAERRSRRRSRPGPCCRGRGADRQIWRGDLRATVARSDQRTLCAG